MVRVILESPYAADSPEGVAANVLYARLCLRDSLLRGEAPIASHLLYTQEGVLDDRIPDERRLGIEAGLAWGAEPDVLTAVYTDHGISRGMKLGIERARTQGRRVEERRLPALVLCGCLCLACTSGGHCGLGRREAFRTCLALKMEGR